MLLHYSSQGLQGCCIQYMHVPNAAKELPAAATHVQQHKLMNGCVAKRRSDLATGAGLATLLWAVLDWQLDVLAALGAPQQDRRHAAKAQEG